MYSCTSLTKFLVSGSGRARRLRLTGKCISHRLVARPEPDNTFWTDSTSLHVFKNLHDFLFNKFLFFINFQRCFEGIIELSKTQFPTAWFLSH